MRSTTGRFFSAISLVVMTKPSSGPTAFDWPYSRFWPRSRSPPSPGRIQTAPRTRSRRSRPSAGPDRSRRHRPNLLRPGSCCREYPSRSVSLRTGTRPPTVPEFFSTLMSSQLSSVTPLRPMTYFGEPPTPISPVTLVEPGDSAMARSRRGRRGNVERAGQQRSARVGVADEFDAVIPSFFSSSPSVTIGARWPTF